MALQTNFWPSHSTPQRRGRLSLYGIALLIMLATLLSSCISPGNSTSALTRRQQLTQLPEYQLVFPGAVELATFGRDSEWTIEGTLSAYAGHLFGANATDDEIFDFYRRELSARGWTYSPGDGIASMGEGRVIGLRKGTVAIRISILDSEHTLTPPEAKSYRTAYRMYIFADPPK